MTSSIWLRYQRLFVACLVLLAVLPGAGALAKAEPLRIVAFGDSLVAGLGVPLEAAFPAQLQQALAARGHSVEIINAGVSGDTTAGGLARLDWSIADGVSAVILELGANDMLRGVDPATTQANLDAMIVRLKQRNIPVLLTGMRASPNMGDAYVQAFDPIFQRLAQKHDLRFYPFFLEGVAGNRELNQSDAMHPTAKGVERIVELFLPQMEAFLAEIAALVPAK